MTSRWAFENPEVRRSLRMYSGPHGYESAARREWRRAHFSAAPRGGVAPYESEARRVWREGVEPPWLKELRRLLWRMRLGVSPAGPPDLARVLREALRDAKASRCVVGATIDCVLLSGHTGDCESSTGFHRDMRAP